jgi:transcriptional regulator with XRE-family HTH domain
MTGPNFLVARTVHDARTARGWSLSRLATASGVSYAALRTLERGWSAPWPETLERLADALEEHGDAVRALVVPELEAEPPVRRSASVLLELDTVLELEAEAIRLDRSASWLMQRAVKLAMATMRAEPSIPETP